MSVFKSSYHRVFVNNLPSCGINDNCSRFQHPDPLFAYQSHGFLSERDMNAKHIRLFKHLLNIVKVFTKLWCVGVSSPGVIYYAHGESMGQNRETRPNPSKPEDGERL